MFLFLFVSLLLTEYEEKFPHIKFTSAVLFDCFIKTFLMLHGRDWRGMLIFPSLGVFLWLCIKSVLAVPMVWQFSILCVSCSVRFALVLVLTCLNLGLHSFSSCLGLGLDSVFSCLCLGLDLVSTPWSHGLVSVLMHSYPGHDLPLI